MKLMWTLSIAWSLCYAATALRCHSCSDSACSSTSTPLQTCSSNQRCITASLDSGVSGSSTVSVFKGCVADSACLTTGTLTISANLGNGTGIASSYCCNTDDCNAATLTVPSASAQTANELKCFTCDEQTTSVCSVSLTCVGLQDRCVNGTVSTHPAQNKHGCVSSDFCGSSARLSVFAPLASLASFTRGPACCDESYCNSASTLSLGGAVVPMVLWVVSVTLTS